MVSFVVRSTPLGNLACPSAARSASARTVSIPAMSGKPDEDADTGWGPLLILVTLGGGYVDRRSRTSARGRRIAIASPRHSATEEVHLDAVV